MEKKFSKLILKIKKKKKNPILKKKKTFIKKNILKIDNNFKF